MFEPAWKVSRDGPNFISVGDTKFGCFGLVRSHARLQCLAVILIRRPGDPLIPVLFRLLLILCLAVGHYYLLQSYL